MSQTLAPPQTMPPQEEKNGSGEHFENAANTIKQVKNFGSYTKHAIDIGAKGATHGIASNVPLVGEKIAGGLDKIGVHGELAQNSMVAFKEGAQTAIKSPLNPLSAALGGITAVAHGADAVKEFKEGDKAEGTGIILGAVTRGGIVATNITGITLFPDIAIRLATGKFASDHIGDFVENQTTKALGGSKEEKEAKRIAEANAVPNPMGVAVVPAGLAAAGLTANHIMKDSGTQYHVGTAPEGINGQVAINAPAAIGANTPQVMQTQQQPRVIAQQQDNVATVADEPGYGKPVGYWQNRIQAERGQDVAVGQSAQNNTALNSGDKSFAQAVERAREAQYQQTDLTAPA